MNKPTAQMSFDNGVEVTTAFLESLAMGFLEPFVVLHNEEPLTAEEKATLRRVAHLIRIAGPLGVAALTGHLRG